MFTVVKPFKTTQRRFAEGDEIVATDCDTGAQFDRFVEMGLIEAVPEALPAAEPQPEAAPLEPAPVEGERA